MIDTRDKKELALAYLRGLSDCGPWCWCGHSRGHGAEVCHRCGQKFTEQNVPRGQLIWRWQNRILRRAYSPERFEQHKRDTLLMQFGNWTYWQCTNWKYLSEWRTDEIRDIFFAAYEQYKLENQLP